MKKRSNTRVFSVLVAIAAFVAIMCMFADLLSEEVASGEGNVFVAMFGMHGESYRVIWPLVGGFVALIVLVGVAAFGFLAGDKAKKIIPLVEFVLGLAVGIFFFFAADIYVNINGLDALRNFGVTLGAGSICVIVFSFLAAAIGALNFFVDRKSN